LLISCPYNGNNLGLVARDQWRWWGQWWSSEINGGDKDSGGALGVRVFCKDWMSKGQRWSKKQEEGP
jgi:hypothetical protein